MGGDHLYGVLDHERHPGSRILKLVLKYKHKAYQDLVEYLCSLLTKASVTERHPLFEQFLAQRARDLLTDDYYTSESSWVRLVDNSIDLVIGPYEVYEDQLMGLKAAYEAMVLERGMYRTNRLKRAQERL